MRILTEDAAHTLLMDRNEDPSFDFEVEAILNHRRKYGTEEFLIRWKGFAESENTWEKRSALEHDGLGDDIKKYLNLNRLSKKSMTKYRHVKKRIKIRKDGYVSPTKKLTVGKSDDGGRLHALT